MRFSFGVPKSTIVALCDIGVASIGAALLEYKKNDHPTILWASRKNYDGEKGDPNHAALLGVLEKQLESMKAEADKRGVVVHRIVLALFPAFFTHYGEVISQKFDTPIFVTEELVARYVAERVRLYADELGIVEQRITNIRLNGYPLPEPFGKKARELEFDLSISVPEHGLVDSLKVHVIRFFPHQHIEIHTVPFLAFIFLRDILQEGEDFVSLLIGADTTEVSCIEQGSLVRTASFPYGRRHVVQKIQAALRTIPEEAESVLRLLDEKKLSQEVFDTLSPILAEARASWQKQFVEVVSQIAREGLVPQRLCLVGDPHALSLFQDVAGAADVSRVTRLAQPFSLHPITLPVLRSFISEQPDARKFGDCFLMLEALALSRHYA